MDGVGTAGAEGNMPEETKVEVTTAETGTAAEQETEKMEQALPAEEKQEPKTDSVPEKQTDKVEETPTGESEEDILKKREEALQKREKALQEKELEGAAKARFQELGIPEGLLPYVIRQDEASTMEYIDKLKTEFDVAVEAALNAKLAGKTPRATSGTVTVGDKSDADVFAAALRG